MLDTHFDHKSSEQKIYEEWETRGAFKPKDDPNADTYSIVIPPPNVTGVLHMGHALNNTLQDVLCRYQRMQGKRVLWQPGTDHAGIATQMVVERKLAKEGNQDRRSMGREEFIKRVWEWKEESGGQIVNQLKRLGASCDWSRERFTLDEGLSKAVTKVFVEMYNQGLIYRDKRLVNWDPHFQTAISDLEVEQKEVDGHFWHFRYPIVDGSTYKYPIEHDEEGNPTAWEERDYIVVATTRPETMLGDTGVAVHPDDERYKDLVGKLVELPLTGRQIPIVADEHADPEKGTGAVKITPAHDFNDFEVGKRANLPRINIFDVHAAVLKDFEIIHPEGVAYRVEAASAPEGYAGLDRFEARKKVVADFEAAGLLQEIEDKKIEQPFGDRSGVVIEPYLTDQWYVDAATLAKPAVAAVKDGKTRFIPETWSKTYYNWMEDIQPWCISRQLWWGHRIPAWFGPDGEIFVAANEAEARKLAEAKHGEGVSLHQDEDVLDTWFSSALWPFSTMGWPEETEELKAFYPTSTLVTAFDIIFFWVARMMMQGIQFMDEVPFKDVYIHALVLDEDGKKMSKSIGNVIDPIDIIDGCDLETLVAKRVKDAKKTGNEKKDKQVEKQIANKTKKQFPDGIPPCGTDALRFTLASQAAQGRDIRLSMERVVGYRNFGTKLWNAARFCQMNECTIWEEDKFDPMKVELTLNKWIVSEVAKTSEQVAKGIDDYRFNEASSAIYKFVWNVFCDWYLELMKPLLNGEDEEAKAETRKTAAWTLNQIITMLHPFMPFVTEALWEDLSEFGPERKVMLCETSWPTFAPDAKNAAAEEEVDWVIRIVTDIRSARADLNVPAGAKLPVSVVGASDATKDRVERYRGIIERLARLENLSVMREAPEKSVSIVVDEATLALEVGGVIDLAAEVARLEKEIGKLDADIDGIDKKLANENFVSRAPEHVVAEQHERRKDAEDAKVKLQAALKTLQDIS